jgi:hypothetical protein
MELHGASLHPDPGTPTVSSALAFLHLRLGTLRSNMEMCRAALGKWRLNPYRSHAARILIEEMERSVRCLRIDLPANCSRCAEPPIELSTIEKNLNHLEKICHQLMGVVFPSVAAAQLAS